MADEPPVPPVRGWMIRDDDYTLDPDVAAWRGAEHWLCNRFDWEDVDAPTHDAITDAGERVEIKTCNWKYQNGEVGHATIWDDQFWEADQLALVVRVDHEGESYVLAYGVVDMYSIEYRVRWQSHPTMGDQVPYVPTTWTSVLTIDDVRPGLRHAFLDTFDVNGEEINLIAQSPESILAEEV